VETRGAENVTVGTQGVENQFLPKRKRKQMKHKMLSKSVNKTIIELETKTKMREKTTYQWVTTTTKLETMELNNAMKMAMKTRENVRDSSRERTRENSIKSNPNESQPEREPTSKRERVKENVRERARENVRRTKLQQWRTVRENAREN